MFPPVRLGRLAESFEALQANVLFPKLLSRAAFGVEPLPRFDSSCYAGSTGHLRRIAVAVLSNISSLGGTFSVEVKIAQAFAASQGR